MNRTPATPPSPRLALPLAVLLAPAVAAAQDAGGLDAHGFALSAYDGDPRDLLTVQRPGRFAQGEWWAGALMEWADQPLTFVYETAEGDAELSALDDLLVTNLSVGAAVHDRLRVDVTAPFYLSSQGLDGAQGAAPGDVRVTGMVALVRPSDAPDGGGFGLGLAPYLDLPSGAEGKFLGANGLAGGARLAATYEIAFLTVSGDVGAQLNPAVAVENLTGSDAVTAGVGLGVLVGPQAGFDLEAHFAPALQPGDTPQYTSPAEALLSFRGRLRSGPHLTVGGAMGLNDAAGSAAYRVFLGAGYGVITPPRPPDMDGDGLLDKVDACISEPEVVNKWKDEDGCPDDTARLAVAVRFEGAPVTGAFVTVRGEEVEKRGTSGVTPMTIAADPETEWNVTASWGPCLTGALTTTAREGDNELLVELGPYRNANIRYRVVDERGAPVPGASVHYTSDARECIPDHPMELADGTGAQAIGAGSHVLYVEAPGYAIWRQPVDVDEGRDQALDIVLKVPKVRVEQKQIVILDKVYFAFNEATILPESYPLLDEVAATILTNPQIRLIEVAGHTDDKGDDAYNMDLSDARAAAVRQYLVDRGVSPARLGSMGYGETRPLTSNTTEGGRAINRRVEFNILQTASVEE